MIATIEQIDEARKLMNAASDRLRVSGESSAFNILSVLHLERYETRTHSRIIFFLLSGRQNGFLRLFLEMLKIPQPFLDERWSVYRERVFDGGASRIDFVLESASFCAIIEMKVDAGDGDRQLSRYAAFGKRKRKEYGIYYLTPDGRRPQVQSVKGVDPDRLRYVSFAEDVVSWLLKCMDSVPVDSWQYSFLKQYLGAVRQITGTGDGEVNVKDLIDSSAMARAAQLVAKSFYEKMDDVKERFFQELDMRIRRKTALDTCLYSDGFDVFLGSITKSSTYYVTLGVFCEERYLYACFGFSVKVEEGMYHFISLADAEKRFPRIYKKWIGKLDALEDMPKLHRSEVARWAYLEDSEGAMLNFQDQTAQIKLLDEIEAQCDWIAEDLVLRWIQPLLM